MVETGGDYRMKKDYMDLYIKYLEMIQTVINRFANNLFIIKGWAIATATAGVGFYLTNKDPIVLIIVLGATILFWYLDALYQRHERFFRLIYEDTILKIPQRENSKITLTMEKDQYEFRDGKKYEPNIFTVMIFSKSIVRQYLIYLIIFLFILFLLVKHFDVHILINSRKLHKDFKNQKEKMIFDFYNEKGSGKSNRY